MDGGLVWFVGLFARVWEWGREGERIRRFPTPPSPLHATPPMPTHQHAHGVGLVQQPDLSVGRGGRAGVGVDAALHQHPVHVRHHGPHVRAPVRPVALPLPELHALQPLAHARVPVQGGPLVQRVEHAARRDAHVGVREDEVAALLVEREALHALLPQRQDQDRLPPVEAVACTSTTITSRGRIQPTAREGEANNKQNPTLRHHPSIHPSIHITHPTPAAPTPAA